MSERDKPLLHRSSVNFFTLSQPLNLGVDSCQGDGGGPLTWFDPQSRKWKLVGVVAFGVGKLLLQISK